MRLHTGYINLNARKHQEDLKQILLHLFCKFDRIWYLQVSKHQLYERIAQEKIPNRSTKFYFWAKITIKRSVHIDKKN